MIALWMLYAVVLATLLGAAAACLEPMLRTARRATRVAWAVALAGSVAAPAGAWLVARGGAERPAPAAATSGEARGDARTLAALLERARVREALPAAASQWQTFDHPLLVAWLAASLVSIGWLALSQRRLRAALRRWRPAMVAGEPVLLSTDVGPAAVASGAGHDGARIVLPTWALALDAERLALMLAHERSHLEAHDPQLLAGAAVAVALAPWNPALWWQLRRLRVAVEIDCDRRVLRRHPDVAAYGALLLDVARRTAPIRLPLAAALSAPTPTTALERRIRTMTTRRPRHPLARALAFGALGTGLVVAACEAPHPTGIKPASSVPLTTLAKVAPEMEGTDGHLTIEKVRLTLREQLPQVASGATRAKTVWLVADSSGRIVKAAYDVPGTKGAVTVRGERVTYNASPTRSLYAENATLTVPDADASALASLDPNAIKSINIFKLGPGQVTPDSVGVIWVTLKAPGAGTASRYESPLRRTVPDGAGTAQARTRYRVAEGGPVEVRMAPTTAADSARTTVPDGSPVRIRMNAAGAAGAAAGQPIFIVDGVVVPPGPDGKPALPTSDRIESVNVIKGPAATKLYGDSAATGVVEIKTKKGATRDY